LVQRLIDKPRNLRASIMRNQEWDPPSAQLHPLNLPELVFSLRRLDPVHGKAPLGIIDKSEMLARLLNADHVHEAGWVGSVSSDFAVDFDEALHEDGFDLAAIQGVLEAVADEDD
jgi:hypothetical protein